MFHRTGGAVVPYDDFGPVIEHFIGIGSDDSIMIDVDAALGYLHGLGFADNQIGLVGFCFGGRVSFLVSTQRAIGAAVGFYGGGIVTAPFPQFPSLIDRAPALQTPWLGLFGDLDASIPVEDVERLRTELTGGLSRRRSRSVRRTPNTASTATPGRRTTRKQPPTRGAAPSTGSRATSARDRSRPLHVTDSDRFARAIAAIDAGNAEDPNVVTVGERTGPKEIVHAELVTAWVERLRPDASEPLLLAARGHHFRRWTVPRSSAPAGRAGYLKWRKSLQVQTASRARRDPHRRGLRRRDDRAGAIDRAQGTPRDRP